MGIDKKNQGARRDYKAESRAMLADCYAIAVEMMARARAIVDKGEDIRSTKDRPGVTTLMHSAEKAISEIIRLTPLAADNTSGLADSDGFEGFDFELPSGDVSA
ncbi:MAG: hypothetical protein GY832_23535 [Chloroflexi bacterium]|nr:hypothetical protein [Chloroflexota bacterium]